MAPKAVSRSFSEEEEGMDTEVAEEVQDVVCQQRRERTQAQKKQEAPLQQAPLQQDPAIKQARVAASKSIKQETPIATTVGKWITGCTNARI